MNIYEVCCLAIWGLFLIIWLIIEFKSNRRLIRLREERNELLKSIDKRLSGIDVNVNNIDCRLMKLMDEE